MTDVASGLSVALRHRIQLPVKKHVSHQNDDEEAGRAVALCRDCLFTHRPVTVLVVDVRESCPSRGTADRSRTVPFETDAGVLATGD